MKMLSHLKANISSYTKTNIPRTHHRILLKPSYICLVFCNVYYELDCFLLYAKYFWYTYILYMHIIIVITIYIYMSVCINTKCVDKKEVE